MDLILLFVMIFTNSALASRKGKSPFLWGFLTLLAFFLATGILGTIYIFATYRGPLTPENMDAIQDYIVALQSDFLKRLMFALFGVGGALLIRYLLSRKPDAGAAANDADQP